MQKSCKNSMPDADTIKHNNEILSAEERFRALKVGYLELEYSFFLTKGREENHSAGIKISTDGRFQNDPFPTNQHEYVEKDDIFHH